jgi:hypothetical protein
MGDGEYVASRFELAKPDDMQIPRCVDTGAEAVAVIRDHHARWLASQGKRRLTRVRAPDRRELVREGAEDGQEPRRRDGGSTGGWKCHNGYVSREPNDIRDDDKAVRAAYFRMVCQHRAERKSAVLTHFDEPKLP